MKASQSGSTEYETFSQTTKEKSRYIRYKILQQNASKARIYEKQPPLAISFLDKNKPGVGNLKREL